MFKGVNEILINQSTMQQVVQEWLDRSLVKTNSTVLDVTEVQSQGGFVVRVEGESNNVT